MDQELPGITQTAVEAEAAAPGGDFPVSASPAVEVDTTGLVVWLATGAWVGFLPWAPGTLGTLWGLPLAWAIGLLPLWLALPAIILLCIAGVPLCTAATRRLGGMKDPSCIVYDEIASLSITFFLVPMTNPAVVIAGFLAHRLFDISKLAPANRLERLPEGLGIMADDVMAGIYSNLLLHALLWLGLFGTTAGP